MIKYIVGLFIATFMFLPLVSHAQNAKSDLDVKLMPGIAFTDGIGGSANFLITSKTLDFIVTPAIDLGLGSRVLSVDQTGEDITTHAGGGLCAFEKILCVAYIYDFQDKTKRVNVTVDVLSVFALSK